MRSHAVRIRTLDDEEDDGPVALPDQRGEMLQMTPASCRRRVGKERHPTLDEARRLDLDPGGRKAADLEIEAAAACRDLRADIGTISDLRQPARPQRLSYQSVGQCGVDRDPGATLAGQKDVVCGLPTWGCGADPDGCTRIKKLFESAGIVHMSTISAAPQPDDGYEAVGPLNEPCLHKRRIEAYQSISGR